MNTSEIITIVIATYGALLSTYTLIAQIRKKSRRLKVTLSQGFLETLGEVSDSILILECSNPGHIDITVTGHAICPPGKYQLIFGTEHQLPHTLAPGEPLILWFPTKEVASSLKRRNFTGTVKIRGVIREATGKSYRSKSLKFNVEEWLDC